MKKTAVILIRDWIRTNGNMSDDGKFITYSCKKLEEVITQAKEMEKQQSNKLLNVIKDCREKLDAEVPFGESDSYDVMV